ncbi:MAG: TorF family putative porin [Bacteroidales bacterium]
MKKVMIVVVLFVSGIVAATAQSKGTFAVGADLVSDYVWRGMQQGSNEPNFQPSLTYTNGALTIGAWGSGNFSGSLKEADLYATYAFSSLFSATVTDYNWIFTPGKSYLEYGKDKTDHIFEVSLNYAGVSSFPLSVSLNTMVYGADKKATDATKQAYSTYYELGYPLADNAKLFLGGTLNESANYYTSGFAVTNVGIKVSKSVVFSDKFSLPVYGVFGVNPAGLADTQPTAFFVVGLTL